MGVLAWLKGRWIREMPAKVVILAQFGHGYYICGTLKWLMGVLVWIKASWICFDHGYYIPGTLKWLMGVLVWLKAFWMYTRNLCHCYLAREDMPTKVVILAQFGHGYYIPGTLKWLMSVLVWLKAWWIRRLVVVLAWLKAWWICVGVKQVTDLKSIPPLPRWRGNARKSRDFGSVWPRILYPWDVEVADGCFGLAQGVLDLYVVACLMACWIRVSVKQVTDQKFMPLLHAGDEMPTKVVILAQFGDEYYIRGTLRGLMGVLVWLKASWMCVSAKQVTDQKSMPPLNRRRGNAPKSHDFGSAWPRILYLWDFEVADGCFGLAQGFLDMLWLGSRLGGSAYCKDMYGSNGHEIMKNCKNTSKNPVAVAQSPTVTVTESPLPEIAWQQNVTVLAPLLPYMSVQEETPPKVMILAQFEHGYYIRGTLKRLMVVLAWLKALWICVGVKQVTDLKSMPPLPRWRGNARKSRDFGSVWPRILYLWDFEEADRCFGLAPGLVDLYVVACLMACWIRVSVKQVMDQKFMPPLHAGEEMPTKVVISAQFGHGYYIRGTLKRPTDVVGWLQDWWICIRNPCPHFLGREETPPKVMILAQFEHGYYIRGTLKRLTDVVGWLQAWWICVFWLGSGLHGLKVLNTWCSCLEFYTIFASKSPALQ
ncbi:hypothetical protein C8R44DRAFT_752705 [Mycena epipterygia]|nr:hypothetical protein C8R44DRAFT_752705 [Mycena epipterygia]